MKKSITTKWYWVLLGLIMLSGAFLRFYMLGSAPYWMDEGYTINAVLSIEATGHSILDSGKAYSCPLYCFPTSWIASSFGDSAFSYRLLATLSGILFIFLAWYVAKRFFGKKVALLTSAVVAFSYLQIAWSRQARWYTLFTVFFWLALYFFYKLLYDEGQSKVHKIKMALGMIVATILACLTHGLGYLLPLIFLGWYVMHLLFVQKKFRWQRALGALLASIGGLIIIDNVFHLGFLMRLIDGVGLYNNAFYYASFLWRTYWLFIIFGILAFCFSKVGSRTTKGFLLFVFVSYLLPLCFLTNIIQYRYLFHVSLAIILLGISGMYEVLTRLKKPFLKYGFIIIFFALFFTIAGGTLIPRSFYLLETDDPEKLPSRDYYAYTPQPDWNAAYAYIASHQTQNDVVISTMPQFTKIFLHTAGYWIKYNYTGLSGPTSLVTNGKEFYVGAGVLDGLDELKAFTSTDHGYLVFDYMAFNGKVSSDIIDYIVSTMDVVYEERTNSYSQVWVFKF